MTIKYRADIDGLRAFAVISVVIFHYFPALLPGGFVGVDVFFVISGYLIGTIIYKDILSDNFSYKEFYIRRALRIFPALILVLTFCYYVGWSVLFEDEFAALGKHIASGAGFISNIISWSESGYFDKNASLKPLLHLWSLGVEEQFYIIIPFLLIVSYALFRNVFISSAIIALASFIYCIVTMTSNPTANYYSPVTRFWELMAGVLLAIATVNGYRLKSEKARNILSLSSALILVLSIFIINEDMPFPGYIAALPVMGAVLFIFSGADAVINRTLFSFKPVVIVGLVSYPLYLWHWPLISFARIIYGSTPDVKTTIVILFAACVLSLATYYLFEKPLRKIFKQQRGRKAIALTGTMMILLCLGLLTSYQNGIPNRDFVKLSPDRKSGYGGGMPKNIALGCGATTEHQKKYIPNCFHDSRGESTYGLIGDSKSMALFPGLMRTAKDAYWTYAGGTSKIDGKNNITMPVITDDNDYSIYQEASKASIDVLVKDNNIKYVVYVIAARAIFQLKTDYHIHDLPASNKYQTAFNGLMVGVKQLIDSGKKVVFVIDNPTLPYPEDCLVRNIQIPVIGKKLTNRNKGCEITLEEHYTLSKKYNDLLEEIQSTHPGEIFLFDTVNILCDKEKCKQTKDGHYLYGVTDHISDYASGVVGSRLNEYLKKLP
ncbi:acyltransferase [Enterobacter kobei]|uniref:acyltransferase family protein n=1 Tax=Enterobacter kobei TaxID=208224 RepID=UPI00217561F3|nr:acyltransferase family protein [Enterobacter kobei]MCS4609151.1 acyltransferase [Enterobacter kobei]